MNSWIFSMTWIFVRLVLWLLSFTPSERMALFAAFLVLLGVIGEEVAELKFLEGEKQSRVKERVKRWAVGILLLGLAGDVVGIVMGQAEMAAVTKQAGEAATSAHNAASDAKTAHDLAQGASDTAGAAKKKAGEAKGKADAADIASGEATRKSKAADRAAS